MPSAQCRVLTTADRRPTTEPYQGFAAVYDKLGQYRWGAALARFVCDVVVPERGIVPRTALDLACGTGAAALVLAEAGLWTVGLDRSAAMLRAARQKAHEVGIALPLVRGDLRSFAFGQPFDLVLCCYDSLNYLTEPRDLAVALRCVREALAPPGIFVCDLTTRHAYTSELDGIPHEFALSNLHYGWITDWDEETHLANTTIAVRTSAYGQPDECAECHQQRPYSPQEVVAALHEAGLRPLAIYGVAADGSPSQAPPESNAPRVVYVATRAN